MTKLDATATAWIKNQQRVIFKPREIRRGRNKGKIECYYKKGKLFKKTVIKQTDIIERIDR